MEENKMTPQNALSVIAQAGNIMYEGKTLVPKDYEVFKQALACLEKFVADESPGKDIQRQVHGKKLSAEELAGKEEK